LVFTFTAQVCFWLPSCTLCLIRGVTDSAEPTAGRPASLARTPLPTHRTHSQCHWLKYGWSSYVTVRACSITLIDRYRVIPSQDTPIGLAWVHCVIKQLSRNGDCTLLYYSGDGVVNATSTRGVPPTTGWMQAGPGDSTSPLEINFVSKRACDPKICYECPFAPPPPPTPPPPPPPPSCAATSGGCGKNGHCEPLSGGCPDCKKKASFFTCPSKHKCEACNIDLV
jgi:hypothetical protein